MTYLQRLANRTARTFGMAPVKVKLYRGDIPGFPHYAGLHMVRQSRHVILMTRNNGGRACLNTILGHELAHALISYHDPENNTHDGAFQEACWVIERLWDNWGIPYTDFFYDPEIDIN